MGGITPTACLLQALFAYSDTYARPCPCRYSFLFRLYAPERQQRDLRSLAVLARGGRLEMVARCVQRAWQSGF